MHMLTIFALGWAPLLNASPAVIAHTFAAMLAFGLGVLQLVAPKGTVPHKLFGYVWCGLMLTAALSSFAIQSINHWRGFSVIHLLSIMVLVQLPIAILAARRGAITAHRKTMQGMFFGGLVIAGAFTLLPGRIMHAVLFG